MSKRKQLQDATDGTEGNDDREGQGNPARDRDAGQPELKRYATMDPGVTINGHGLDAGTVVELSEEEAANHRSRGVRLDDVADDDRREVKNVREMYVAEENNE